jgi:hypothetical protein
VKGRTFYSEPEDAIQMSAQNIPNVVTELERNDVLLGRGAASINYVGNVLFREIVRERRDEYLSTARRQTKDDIARQIIDVVSSRNGRFLRKIVDVGEKRTLGIPEHVVNAYVIVGKEKKLEKVKQSLRDKEYNPLDKLASRASTSNSRNSNEDDDRKLHSSRDNSHRRSPQTTTVTSVSEGIAQDSAINNIDSLRQLYADRISSLTQTTETVHSSVPNYLSNNDAIFGVSAHRSNRVSSMNNVLQQSVSDRANQVLLQNQEIHRYRALSLMTSTDNDIQTPFSHQILPRQRTSTYATANHGYQTYTPIGTNGLMSNEQEMLHYNTDDRQFLELVNFSRSQSSFSQDANSPIEAHERNCRLMPSFDLVQGLQRLDSTNMNSSKQPPSSDYAKKDRKK